MENLREMLADLKATMDMMMIEKSIDDRIEKGTEPSVVRAVDDFINYVSMNEKIISDMPKDEYNRFKNNFILALEEELTKFYNKKHRN